MEGRAAIERELASIAALLAGRTAISEFDEQQKIDLINAQGRANAMLTQRDGERLICERRKIMGSNRRDTVCETYAEQQSRSRNARFRADELNRRVQQCDDNGRCTSG